MTSSTKLEVHNIALPSDEDQAMTTAIVHVHKIWWTVDCSLWDMRTDTQI